MYMDVQSSQRLDCIKYKRLAKIGLYLCAQYMGRYLCADLAYVSFHDKGVPTHINKHVSVTTHRTVVQFRTLFMRSIHRTLFMR